MKLRSTRSPRFVKNIAVASSLCLALGVVTAALTPLLTNNGYAQSDTSPDSELKKAKKAKAGADVATPATAVAAPAAAASPTPAAGDFQLTTQLQAAGVKTCLDTATNMGRFEMTGATEYAASSTWNKTSPDKRQFTSIIGQKFGQSTATPLGLSGVISSPGAEGKCDAVALQILPSVSACSAIQSQVLVKGEMLGNLAGVPMMRNAQNLRVMLLPTAGNGCVIVGMSNFYTE